MTNIDPEEDKLRSIILEIVTSFIETGLIVTGASDEKFEILSKFKMEFQLVIDKILQIEPAARTRADIQSSVNDLIDRMSRSYPIFDEYTEGLTDSLCEFFSIV